MKEEIVEPEVVNDEPKKPSKVWPILWYSLATATFVLFLAFIVSINAIKLSAVLSIGGLIGVFIIIFVVVLKILSRRKKDDKTVMLTREQCTILAFKDLMRFGREGGAGIEPDENRVPINETYPLGERGREKPLHHLRVFEMHSDRIFDVIRVMNDPNTWSFRSLAPFGDLEVYDEEIEALKQRMASSTSHEEITEYKDPVSGEVFKTVRRPSQLRLEQPEKAGELGG